MNLPPNVLGIKKLNIYVDENSNGGVDGADDNNEILFIYYYLLLLSELCCAALGCAYTTDVYCGASDTCCSDEIFVGLCLIDGDLSG